MKAFCYFSVPAAFILLTIFSGCSAARTDGAGESPTEAGASDQTSFTSPADATHPADTAPTQGSSGALDNTAPEAVHTDDIELRFAIPAEQIDGFIIYYGFSAELLSNEVKVPVAELETVEQAGQGKVYRYLLRELPSNQPLFISLAAFRGEAISPKTDVVEIETGAPNTSLGTPSQ